MRWRSLMKFFYHTSASIKTFFSNLFVLLIVSLSTSSLLRAQTDSVSLLNDTTRIDVAKIRLQEIHYKKIFYTTTAIKGVNDNQIPHLPFERVPFARNRTSVPPALMEKTIYLKFTVFNSADTAKAFHFMPSRFCKDVCIFLASPGNIEGTFRQLPKNMINNPEFSGYKTLRIAARDTVTVYTRFNFMRANVNSFSPRFIEDQYGTLSIKDLKTREPMLDMITYLSAGILLLMIFYSLAAYIQYLNIEFIYYSAYAFCSGLLLFLKSYLSMEHTSFNFFYEEYLDFMILCMGATFYLIFVRKFLNSKISYPSLDKFLRIAQLVLLALIIIFSFVYFLTDKYISLLILENYVIKVFLCLIGIVFIVYSIGKKNTLMQYLAAGNICLIFFSILSLCMILFNWEFVPSYRPSIWNRPLFYYELGIVLELIFFLSGLAYKNRRDIIEQVKERERFKLENERKEFEKQMAVMAAQQDERNRISADMHDELGSGVTAIRLMSEIVKSKMKQTSLPEIDKISNSANDLLGKMNTIIWTMKSSNDTLESLIAYIRAHAIEYFDSTPIDCTVKVEDVPDVEMTGEKRRNIFLGVKEALNNIMKHSQATNVVIDIMVRDYQLVIKIADNGIGIDTEKLRRFGNGLSNMKRRMQSINGDFRIETDRGTTLYFELPV